jgi:hypothetical protein
MLVAKMFFLFFMGKAWGLWGGGEREVLVVPSLLFHLDEVLPSNNEEMRWERYCFVTHFLFQKIFFGGFFLMTQLDIVFKFYK